MTTEQQEILQPNELNKMLEEKYVQKRIFDEFGWTGEYSLSCKDIIDLIIDFSNKPQTDK